MNILIPAAGAGRRFREAGYKEPKPLIYMRASYMLQEVVRNVQPFFGDFKVILLASRYVRDRTRNLWDDGWVVDGVTDGAARTALVAKSIIDNDNPLLIANSDQLIDWRGSIDSFISAAEKGDGGVVLFESDGNPKWSYADFDPELGRITKIAEKRVISNYATAGIYYWKRGRDFVRSAEQMIAKNIRTNCEFYIAPSYNELIAEGATIVPYVIPATAMHGLGTPEDLEAYLASR